MISRMTGIKAFNWTLIQAYTLPMQGEALHER